METMSVAAIRRLFATASPDDLADLIRRHADDERPGVAAACAGARRRTERERAEDERLGQLLAAERALNARGLMAVAGVDEVGRGALAGPVTAAACVLPPEAMIRGVADSKTLTPAHRVRLDAEIRAVALGVAVGHVDPVDIDRLGIARATAEAMRRAVAGLGCPVDHILVDGNPTDLGLPATFIVRGDGSVRAIAAASIVAKVARDQLMCDLDLRYPGYGLAGNKGYGSADHLAAITRHGPSPAHRRSFAPCAQPPLF
jgi:ribonuclease HII